MLRPYKCIRPAAGFQVDEAPTNHPHTAELFATVRDNVRDNGRIIDDTRMLLGKSEIFDAYFKLGKIFKFPGFKDWSLHVQRWGRDLDLRKGLLSCLWQDVTALVATREADVIDENGAGIGQAEYKCDITCDTLHFLIQIWPFGHTPAPIPVS
jgi:hypothetical protein